MGRRERRYRRALGRHGEPMPLLLVADTGHPVLDTLAFLGRAVFRFRSALAPLALAGVVAGVGVWLHARHPDWWPGLTTATAVLALTVAFVPRRWVPGWAVLDRWLERLYAATVTATIGGWLTAVTALGIGHEPLTGVWVWGTLALAVPWWTHHRRRARVRVERVVDGWPGVADAAGLAGSRVLTAVVTAWGYSLRLALAAGHTAQMLIDRIPAIESALATRPGAVRVEPDPDRADRALVRVIDRDPHAAPIPWPAPTGVRSITRPVLVGVWEDGTPVWVWLLRRHVLVGGVMGSGKSGVLNVILAALTGCPDVLVWGIDLKEGMELQPWSACLARLAVNPTQAVELLRATVVELNRRAGMLAGQGRRVWDPTPTAPALVVVIDEYAELDQEAHELADSIARRGRAVAVTLLVATQRPTQQAMGQGAVRSQMDVRISLRVRERRDTDLILGAGMLATGWHAHTLDAPGKFLLSAPEHTTPRRARAFHLTDAQVHDTAARNTGHRPRVGPEPVRTPPQPPPPQPRTGSRTPDPTSGDTRSGSPETNGGDNGEKGNVSTDPAVVLWMALQRAPADGVPIGELMNRTGMGRTWVYERLQEHATADRATQVRRGHWRANRSTQ